MENASKALLMAGAVLIGVLILSLLSYYFSKNRDFASGIEKTLEVSQIEANNVQYLAFNRNDLIANDIVSVINLAKDNNAKWDGNSNYTVAITCNGDSRAVDWNSEKKLDFLKANLPTSEDAEATKFKCTKVRYHVNRVSKLNGIFYMIKKGL